MNLPSSHKLTTAVIALLLAAGIGCGSKQVGDDVAASVDGRKIYRTDVEKYYQNQTAGSQQQPLRRASHQFASQHSARAD